MNTIFINTVTYNLFTVIIYEVDLPLIDYFGYGFVAKSKTKTDHTHFQICRLEFDWLIEALHRISNIAAICGDLVD